MKLLFITLILALSFGLTVKAQNVGIGTTTPNANAALEINSNNKGLLMPRLSTSARNSMVNVSKGMLVYDSTTSVFYYHDGGKWLPISQPNSDSLLRYSYPGVAPSAHIMSSNDNRSFGKYGTLYDNGGPAGNYANSSNDTFTVLNPFDSTVLVKVEVIEMNIESPYDSLEIYSEDDFEHKQLFTGNRTGTFYFNGEVDLVFRFRSNGVNNLSGFKINWTRIATNSQTLEAPPLSGWYFNPLKMAARIGTNSNGSWASDNLGHYSFAIGPNAVAKEEYSYASGYKAEALGRFSTAIGLRNKAAGTASIALGYNNIAIGQSSTVLGNSNIARGLSSAALGASSVASADYSTAIGVGLVSNSRYSLVIGFSNDTSDINRIFEIGNGFSGVRSNALTVLKNGNTGLGTAAPTTTLEVNGGIKTKYSGSVIKSVTGTGSAALVNLTIPALPAGWDLTNTLVLVSLADGTSGIIYRTKLTSTSNIELFFEANATGATRFNYIVFKL
jgi:Head domain of trimeric autotransporter adhesin